MVEPWQLARNSDPDTSHAAARTAERIVLTAAVLDVVHRCGPSTVCEVAHALGINAWRTSKRMSDLKNDGLVVDTGTRRRGDSGRHQIVWGEPLDKFGGDEPW